MRLPSWWCRSSPHRPPRAVIIGSGLLPTPRGGGTEPPRSPQRLRRHWCHRATLMPRSPMPRLSPSRRSQRRTAARGARALRHRAGLRLQCPRSAPLRAGGQPCPLGFRHGRATPHGLLCEQAWAKEALLILPGGRGGGEVRTRRVPAEAGVDRGTQMGYILAAGRRERTLLSIVAAATAAQDSGRVTLARVCGLDESAALIYIYIYVHVLFLSTFREWNRAWRMGGGTLGFWHWAPKLRP